jgi:hypothetical protein
MAGDVVLGLKEGVVFVPAHLAQHVVEQAELTQLKDRFGFQRLKDGVYTGGQIDGAWEDPVTEDFHGWVRQIVDTLPEYQQTFLRDQSWF